MEREGIVVKKENSKENRQPIFLGRNGALILTWSGKVSNRLRNMPDSAPRSELGHRDLEKAENI
jgi:hypothetical protein